MSSTASTSPPLPPPRPGAEPQPAPRSAGTGPDADTERDRGRGLGYLPGLDGLRAVAVVAVFAFHAGVLDGGFLGVDVFFVISGFLITGLAVQEIESTGRLGLGAFWARRARRLLPAVIALCAVVVAWSFTGGRRTDSLDGEVASTLLYVANWHRLRSGYEYFAAYEEPSLLEHTWSLAVEEQFYVVWPLVIVAVAWLAVRLGSDRMRVRHWVAGAAGVALVASIAWAWVLAADDTIPVNRLYFGTDTRGVGLAIGCVAGCLLTQGRRTGDRSVPRWLTALGLAGAALLAVAMTAVDGSERWLYGLGFAVFGVASLVLLLSAIGDGPVAGALSWGPLVLVGRVSYGVYLWHWPVIVVLDSDRTGLDGPSLGALWVAATAGLTWISWVFVERRAPMPSVEKPLRAVAYTAAVALVAGASVVAADVVPGTGNDSDVPLALPSDIASEAAAEVDADTNPDRRDAVADGATDAGAGAAVGPGDDPAGANDGDETAPRSTIDTEVDADADPDEVPVAADGAMRDVGDTEDGVDQQGDGEEPTSVADGTTSDADRADEPAAIADSPQLPSDRPLRVLLLGDSVAESLGDPIAETMQIGSAPVSFVNRSVVACPVTFEGRWAFDTGRLVADPPECDSPDRFAADVAETDPDVVVLMFGWAGTIAGREVESGEIVAACDPEFDRRYADAYAALAERMSTDARVVVTTVAPPTEFRDPSQVDRPACINAQIESLGYDVFDFGEWLCPGADCTAALPLLRDPVHFSGAPEVRDLVWPALAREFVTAAGYDVEPPAAGS